MTFQATPLTSLNDFLLKTTTPEERAELYLTYKSQLLELTLSFLDFFSILEFIPTSLSQDWYTLCKPKLILWAKKDCQDFVQIFKGIPQVMYDDFCREFTEHWLLIIKNSNEFAGILRNLPLISHRKLVYQHFKPHMSEILNSAFAFNHILKYLHEIPEIQSEIYEDYKKYFSQFITVDTDKEVTDFVNIQPSSDNADTNFVEILEFLTPAQRSNEFNNFKDYLAEITNSFYEFVKMLNFLDENECKEACERLKNTFANLLTSSIPTLPSSLSTKKIILIFENAAPYLPKILTSEGDIENIVRHLKPETIAEFKSYLQTKVNDFILRYTNLRATKRGYSFFTNLTPDFITQLEQKDVLKQLVTIMMHVKSAPKSNSAMIWHAMFTQESTPTPQGEESYYKLAREYCCSMIGY